jgi:glycosyltransferase involved in cell wall biosynthesis
MHVAFVTPEFLKDRKLYPGGLATYIFVTAKALMDRGASVSVYMLSDRDEVFDFEGIRVVGVLRRIPLLMRPIAKLVSKRAPAAVFAATASWSINSLIRRHRRRQRIDIIQYTNWKSIGLFRLRKGALARISSYERLWDNDPSVDNLDKKLCRWLESTALRRFRVIIGPGEHLASIIERDLKLAEAIRIVPTPVGRLIKPSKRSFREKGRRLVMYAGTLSRIKGVDLLLQTADICLERHADIDFLVVGKIGRSDGKSVKPKLDSMSKSHPGRFIHFEKLEKTDLMAAYSQADLVVIPSLIDNFPNTALEAASQGTLLVASDTASLDSLLTDGENAFVVHSRSPEAWAEAIGKALHLHPNEAEAMRREMRRRLRVHEPDITVQRLWSVYEDLLQESEGEANHTR